MDFDKFCEIFADSELKDDKIIIRNNLREVIKFVKENYSFDILQEIVGVHDKNNKIELIYHMYSSIDKENLFISIMVDNEADSIIDIFPSAIADENEIYDLFGVNFVGHEDLKRLYMPDGWKGYPLRKDYVQDDTRLCWNDENNV